MTPLAKVLLSALPLALLSCGQRDPVADAKFANEQRIGREDVTKRQQQDADFMVEATTGSLFATALGQLAGRRASSPAVRTLGQQLTRDASLLSSNLLTVATQKGLTVPAAFGTDQQEQLDKLAKLSGPAFDRQWLAAADDYLDDAHDAFDDMGDDAYDGDIRAVAAKYAPTLKAHYEQADQLEDTLPK